MIGCVSPIRGPPMLQRCPCIMEGAEPPYPMSNTNKVHHPEQKSKRRFSARAVPAVPFVPVVPPRTPDNGRAGRSIRPARFMPCQCASVRRSPARASLHPCGWSRRRPWPGRLRGGSSACQVHARPWGPFNCVACSRWLAVSRFSLRALSRWGFAAFVAGSCAKRFRVSQ